MSLLFSVFMWIFTKASLAMLGGESWVLFGVFVFIFMTVIPFVQGYLFEYFASNSDRLENFGPNG